MYGAQGGAGGHAWGGAPGGAGGAGGNIHFHANVYLTTIKNDDKVIQAEGVESLSEEELRQACREQLRDWLDPSTNHAMPMALRVLSRAFTVPTVCTTSSGRVLPSEDLVSVRRKKLEFLEMQEELIKVKERKKEKEERAKQKKEEKAKLKEPEADEQDLALKEMTEPTAREEEEPREGKQRDKEQLCNISRAWTVLASASSVSKECQELLSLVNEEIGLYNSMIEKEGTDGEEAKRASMAAGEDKDDSDDVAAEEKVSPVLIEKVKERKKEKEERAKQKKEEKAKLKEPEADEQDLALKEMTEPTAREEEELREGKQRDKEQLCNISRAWTVLASASSVSKECQELLSLVNEEIGLYNSMIEKEGTDGEEAKRASMAAGEDKDDSDDVAAEEKVSPVLIEKVDAMLQELGEEINDVDAQIGNRWQLLDRDHDGKVTPEEVVAAAAYLKDTIGKEGVRVLTVTYL